MTDLQNILAGQRAHVLATVDGLSESAMLRRVLPSGWCMAAMLRHLTHDDELFWFAGVVAGDPAVPARVARHENGFDLPDGFTGAQAVAEYRAATDRTDAIVAATPADAPLAWWPEFFGPAWMHTVADVQLHMITETAAHCGHLDAARELIDGRQWLVLT